MTEKELKYLSRAELVEIIYEQQKQLKEQKNIAETLRAKLDDRELRIAEAGSIAEAALKLNGVFEAAQAAAGQYLDSVKAASADMEEKALQAETERRMLLSDAKEHSDELIRQAEKKAASIIATADRECEEKWKEIERRAHELIAAHKELQLLTGGDSR